MSFVTLAGVRVNTAGIVSVEKTTGHEYEMQMGYWRMQMHNYQGRMMLAAMDSATLAATTELLKEPSPIPPWTKDFLVTVVGLADGRKIEVPGKTVEEVEAMIDGSTDVSVDG